MSENVNRNLVGTQLEHNCIIYLLETALSSNPWRWDFKVPNGSDLDSGASLVFFSTTQFSA